MYPTVVSPPNSMHPTAPASPRMAQPSSYSLPPSNREARLLAQPKAQSHTVAPGGIVPTSKNSNKQKEKGFSLQKSPQKTLTKEESAKMIQQTFKKSPVPAPTSKIFFDEVSKELISFNFLFKVIFFTD